MGQAKYDIRVARLIKSTEKNMLRSYLQNVEANANVSICLGHFDIMVMNQLCSKEAESPLTTVRRDAEEVWTNSEPKQKPQIIENNYVYPLYAIRQLEEGNNEVINEFWKVQTNYFVVTRLHCEHESGLAPDYIQILNEQTKSVGKCIGGDHKNLFVEVEAPVKNQPVSIYVSFYESLELGDIVGFIKSDSLVGILNLQRALYECEYVSDAYTYCGINRRCFIYNSGFPLHEKMLKNINLDYAATRFSVKHAEYAQEVFDEISASKFFIMGNADAIIEWGQINEKDFIDAMKKIINFGNKIYFAFNDIITRVGIESRPPIKSRKKGYVPQRCEEIHIEDEFLDEICKEPHANWKYPLLKLSGTLNTMYNNSVMDDLADLLIPSVNALIKRITYCIKNKIQFDEKEVLVFINQCISLTNDILHLESQLAQHPELMPTIYFIPAMMLGFEQHFIRRCAKALNDVEKLAPGAAMDYSKVNSSFIPIVFPTTERNATTKCCLDPKGTTHDCQDVPMRTFVPINLLYSPWKTVHILCHEIAHYCGNRYRHREARFEVLINCTAEFVLQMWEANQAQTIKHTKESLSLLEGIRLNLAEEIKKRYPNNDLRKKQKYLRDVEGELILSFRRYVTDPIWQERFEDQVLSVVSGREKLERVYANAMLNTMYSGLAICDAYNKHLKYCIISLCKECYADIVMILLLQCGFTDYYECVYVDEFDRVVGESIIEHSRNDFMANMQEFHTDRLALVWYVLQDTNVNGWDVGRFDSTKLSRADWATVAKKKVHIWTKRSSTCEPTWPRHYINDGAYTPYRLSGYEANELIAYLSKCAKDIQTGLVTTNDSSDDHKAVIAEINSLRKILQNTRETDFDWNEIRKATEKLRLNDPLGITTP